jgi:hypothetical protein
MGIAVTFFCVGMVEHGLVVGRLEIEPFSLALGVFGLFFYLVVHAIKKRSMLLSVEGR